MKHSSFDVTISALNAETLALDVETSAFVAAPLEFFFQEQSYSSLHSGQSLTWDHVRGNIDDPCGVIADFCGVIADPCGVIADFCGVIADPCGVL